MRLHSAPASPYVRMVRVLLAETGQTDAVELVPASGTPLDPGSLPLAQNPLGKIPVLERPDGAALYDSRVILRFLDHRAGGMLSPQPPRLWDCVTLEATAHGIMDAAILMVYEGRIRPEELRFEPWVGAQWGKATRALDTLGERWMAHLYGPLDMSQIAVACALGYLDFRHPDRDWRAGRDALAAWYAKFCERDSMKATAPHA